MGYRIVRRHLTRWERTFSMLSSYEKREPRYFIERYFLGKWRKLAIDVDWCRKYDDNYLGSYGIYGHSYESQYKAEKTLELYVRVRASPVQKKTVDVIAEFEYTGPTAMDRLLERIM